MYKTNLVASKDFETLNIPIIIMLKHNNNKMLKNENYSILK